MKLYKDKELTQEVSDLDLGTLMAGDTKQFEYFVSNDSKATLQNIKFETSHKEVKVINSPTTLKSKESGTLTVEWSPSLTLKEGLKTLLKFSAIELWS